MTRFEEIKRNIDRRFWYFVPWARKFIESYKYIYIYFTAQFESNCASDLVSFDHFTAKTRWGGLGGCIGSGDLVPRVSRKESLEMRELKRSLLLRVDFFQMTTRDRREREKFWPGFRGHLDAYIRHRRSRKSSFRCRATCLFEPRYPLDAPLLSCFRISRHSELPSICTCSLDTRSLIYRYSPLE